MGTRGPKIAKLDTSSPDGEPPKLKLSSEQVSFLGELLHSEITDEQKNSLETICNDYLSGRIDELTALPQSKLREYLAPIQKSFEAFSLFAYGSKFPHDDAGFELKWIIKERMNDYLITLPPEKILTIAENSSEWELAVKPGEERLMAIRLDMNLLSEIMHLVSKTLTETENEILEREKSGDKGFVEGTAFKEWAEKLRTWARDNEFPYGLYIDSTSNPAIFAEFAFTLYQYFPENLREEAESAKSMAARLKKARSKKK